VQPHSLPEPGRFTRFFIRLHERPAWAVPAAVLGCVGAGVAYTLAVNPTAAHADATPSCAFKLLTGFDCPGCGGTRALWYLLHGNVPEAARHHMVAVFAAPFLVYLFVAWASNRIFRTKIPMLPISSKVIGIFLGVWAVFSVLRNLPWEPFSLFYV
jgi:hypothetical protein